MSKITKSQAFTPEQLAARLGCTRQDAEAIISSLGPVDESSVDLAREILSEIRPQATAIESVEEHLDPQAELKRASDIAMRASIKAAATMGDATSNLFSEVERQLTAKRQDRDVQIAAQIAQRVFEEENKALGESFGKVLSYVSQFDPFKGTELEGVTGTTKLDLNAMLLPSGSNSSAS